MRIRGIQIEPTNMCTLQCPRCSRTTFKNKFPRRWKNTSINLEHLVNFLDVRFDGVMFQFNGNYGDPIYYDKLLDLVQFIKNNGGSVAISTNGSYQTRVWWDDLSSKLTAEDIITFSIDGTPENFTNYRVNADWGSILEGIASVTKSQAHTVWKFIPFSFNENDIEKCRDLSYSLGISEFAICPSDRWEVDDSLKPIKFFEAEYRNANKPTIFPGIREPAHKKWDPLATTEVSPQCLTGQLHFISADGFYHPCCWMAEHNFYYKSVFYKNKDLFDISKTTMTEVLSSPLLVAFNEEIMSRQTSNQCCTFNCPKI